MPDISMDHDPTTSVVEQALPDVDWLKVITELFGGLSLFLYALFVLEESLKCIAGKVFAALSKRFPNQTSDLLPQVTGCEECSPSFQATSLLACALESLSLRCCSPARVSV